MQWIVISQTLSLFKAALRKWRTDEGKDAGIGGSVADLSNNREAASIGLTQIQLIEAISASLSVSNSYCDGLQIIEATLNEWSPQACADRKCGLLSQRRNG